MLYASPVMCELKYSGPDFLKGILHSNVKTYTRYVIVGPLFDAIFCQLLINLNKFWIYFISTERRWICPHNYIKAPRPAFANSGICCHETQVLFEHSGF